MYSFQCIIDTSGTNDVFYLPSFHWVSNISGQSCRHRKEGDIKLEAEIGVVREGAKDHRKWLLQSEAGRGRKVLPWRPEREPGPADTFISFSFWPPEL